MINHENNGPAEDDDMDVDLVRQDEFVQAHHFSQTE